jgi:hypothetical protein
MSHLKRIILPDTYRMATSSTGYSASALVKKSTTRDDFEITYIHIRATYSSIGIHTRYKPRLRS